MEAVDPSFDVQKFQTMLVGLGSGGVLGVITGAAIKHMARRVAIALGTVFIFLQVAQFIGVVDVHWDKISKSAMPVLDVNEDGKLDEEDMRHIIQNVFEVAPEILMKGLPNVAGFATGMMTAFWFL